MKNIVLDKKAFNIIALFLISIFCISVTPVVFQNDTFYTIKIGEQIKNFGIDFMDRFSFHENLGYSYPHWLYDLVTYLIYLKLGFKGIYISTCVCSIILGCSMYILSSKICKNRIISLFITILMMWLLEDFIAARAQLVTFILFILTVFSIEMFLDTGKRRYAALLIIIPMAIANIHAAVWPFYFVLYLPYIAEQIVIAIYNKVHDSKLENKELYKIKVCRNGNIKHLTLIMAIAGLTGFLTPLKGLPYTYLIKTIIGNTTTYIIEHQPITLFNYPKAFIFVIAIVLIITFTKVKIKLSDLFMLGGLCLLMVASQRQFSMLVVVSSILLSRIVADLIGEKTNQVLNNVVTTWEITMISIVVIMLSSCLALDKFGGKFVDETSYPVQACDYINENIDVSKARFYNEYSYGSYMMFRNIPVFIDSRADLYAPEFSKKQDDIFLDYINTNGLEVFYEDTFDKYDITHIIIRNNSELNIVLKGLNDEKYKVIYSDKNFTIYEINKDK